MTRYPHVCLAAAVVLALASQASAQGVKSDQDTLIELEQKWNAAFQGRDAAFIELGDAKTIDRIVINTETHTSGEYAIYGSSADGLVVAR